MLLLFWFLHSFCCLSTCLKKKLTETSRSVTMSGCFFSSCRSSFPLWNRTNPSTRAIKLLTVTAETFSFKITQGYIHHLSFNYFFTLVLLYNWRFSLHPGTFSSPFWYLTTMLVIKDAGSSHYNLFFVLFCNMLLELLSVSPILVVSLCSRTACISYHLSRGFDFHPLNI